MLLPTKGIGLDRALLTVGADILEHLASPASVSGLWVRFNDNAPGGTRPQRITFDWFTLALSCLYALGAIEATPTGHLGRASVSS